MNAHESAAADPFALLQLPAQFALRRSELDQHHRELSKALHPDRHRDKPAGERRMLLERAMQVNEAHRVLRDPVRRARALLSLRGLGAQEGDEPSPSPMFLMQVMDEREALAEAIARRDGARLESLAAQVSVRCAQTEQELADAFAGARDLEALRALLPLVAQLRYDARFLEEARAAADEFG